MIIEFGLQITAMADRMPPIQGQTSSHEELRLSMRGALKKIFACIAVSLRYLLLTLSAILLLNLLLKITLLSITGMLAMTGAVLASWKTFLTAALLLALKPAWKLCRKTADIAGRKAVRIIKAAAVILPILALFSNPLIYHLEENRFGILAEPPYYDGWHDRFHRYRPPIHVKSNRYGYRDADFSDSVEGGTRRAVIIGDSFVYGTGIPDEEMMIDRLLEKNLREKSGIEWEVLNFGFYGLGLRSYWKVADRVLDALKTDLIIICTLGLYDLDFFSAQTIYDEFGDTAYRIFSALGVVDDLHAATISIPSCVFL